MNKIDNDVDFKNRSIPCFGTREKERNPRAISRAWKMPRSSSFFLFPNATSNGPRPPVLWCPVFRLSVFVGLTSAFFPSFVTTRVFAGGKLSCTGIINFSYPRRRASPRFQAHPAWTYFRRSTFFVSRTGRGREERRDFWWRKGEGGRRNGGRIEGKLSWEENWTTG